MSTRISNSYITPGKRAVSTGHPHASDEAEALEHRGDGDDTRAERHHAEYLVEALSEQNCTMAVRVIVSRQKPAFLSRHPDVLLALANAATRGAGEDADLLERTARLCLQATQSLPEPWGPEAAAVWESLTAQLRGLPLRLERTLIQALESFPSPEALRQNREQARQVVPVITSIPWPEDIMKMLAWQPPSGPKLGSMAAFYREVNGCLNWMLVDKTRMAEKQPQLDGLVSAWVKQLQVLTSAPTPVNPKALSLCMFQIYAFSCLANPSSGLKQSLLVALDEATERGAPRQLQTLLPYLWTQACLKWTRAHEQSQLLGMGRRLLAQVELCSLPVQRRLLVGMAYGGDHTLREMALQRLSQIEEHPSLHDRLRVKLIQRCLGSAKLTSEEIDAVLLDLEQTPPDQAAELGYLRQLVKVSRQSLSERQYERALNCTLVLRRFEAHCDRLGVPQTAHESIYFELGNSLPTTSTQAYRQLEAAT